MPTSAPAYRPKHAHAVAKQTRRESDRRRGNAQNRGYTAQWSKYALTFLAENPICACGCNRPATCVDHIIPIDGADDALFWETNNHQPLTHACHTRKTKRFDDLLRALRSGQPTTQWALEDVEAWHTALKIRGLMK